MNSQNLLTILQHEQIKELKKNKPLPYFKPGDTVRVKAEFSDGVNTRLQDYEGIVIERRNKGIASSFSVRKVTGKLATERRFPLFGDAVRSVEIVKAGKVRRAKLYYLRDKFGKANRIKEDTRRKILLAQAAKKQ